MHRCTIPHSFPSVHSSKDDTCTSIAGTGRSVTSSILWITDLAMDAARGRRSLWHAPICEATVPMSPIEVHM